MKPPVHNRFALEDEDDNKHEKKGTHGDVVENSAELLEEIFAPVLQNEPPGDAASNERDEDKQDDADDDDSPRQLDRRELQQADDNWDVEREQQKIVDSDLDERVLGVATREFRPHKNHGRARGSAKKHRPCNVLVLRGDVEDVGINNPEKPNRKAVHHKRLDSPVHDGAHDDASRSLRHVPNRVNTHLHHHRKNHKPDQNGCERIDVVKRCFGERCRNARHVVPNQSPRDHAEEYPHRQILSKHAKWGRLVGLCRSPGNFRR